MTASVQFRRAAAAGAVTLVLVLPSLLLQGKPALLLAAWIPLVLSPLPTLVTAWSAGAVPAAAAAAVPAAALALLAHPAVALVFVVEFALPALLAGRLLARGRGWLQLLGVPAAVSAACLLAGAALLRAGDPQGVAALVEEARAAVTAMAEENARTLGLDPVERVRYRRSVEAAVDGALRLLPALTLAHALTLLGLNLAAALGLAGRMGLDRAALPPFGTLEIPFAAAWALIAAVAVYLLDPLSLGRAGLNAALILLLAYLVQGLAVLSFLLQRTSLPAAAKAFLYAAVFLNFPLLAAVLAVGLFEPWIQLRRRLGRPGTRPPGRR